MATSFFTEAYIQETGESPNTDLTEENTILLSQFSHRCPKLQLAANWLLIEEISESLLILPNFYTKWTLKSLCFVFQDSFREQKLGGPFAEEK